MQRKIEIREPQKVEKSWGYELILENEKYCSKILHFYSNKMLSLHYHVYKTETWYIANGKFNLISIDTQNAIKETQFLKIGDVIHIPCGMPHQLVCLEEGDIFEASTKHFDEDSYRIEK